MPTMPPRSLHPRHATAIDVIETVTDVRFRPRCRCGEDLGPAIRLRSGYRAADRIDAFNRALRVVRRHERANGVLSS